MRIHRLELTNVRGIEHLVLDELPETGVVVIHGENEAGKSTIVEALDVVLTEKHSGRSKRIRALQPVGKDVAPEAMAELSVGDYRFRIAKRWLSKKSCELNISSPRPAQFTGSQADDELERILSEHLDRSLVDALFMRQDDTGEAISAVGIPSLTRALERESGLAEEEVSGDDSALLARVDKEYQRYFTAAKGNPAGEYKESAEALSRAEEEYAEATRVLRELDSVVERYEQLEREQDAAQAELPAARADLAQKQADSKEAATAQAKLDSHKATLEHATDDLARAQTAVAERAELVTAADKSAKAAEAAQQKLTAAQDKAKQEAAEKERLEKRLAEAKEDYAAARSTLKQARRLQDKQKFEQLSSRLESLGALATEVDQARSIVAQRGREVTAADITGLHKADSALSVAERLHEAAAAKVHFSGPAGSTIRVDGDDVEVGEDTAIELVDSRVITIGDITARFSVGSYSAEDTQRDVEQARVRLRDLLDTLGVESVAAAEEAHEAHRAQNDALDAASRALSAELGPDDLADLRSQHSALAEKVADLEDAAEVDLPAVEAAEEAASEKVDAIDRELVPFRESRLAHEVVRLDAELDAARENAQRVTRELASARERATDETLHAEVTRLQATVADLRGQLEHMEAVDLETANSLLEGAQSHLDYLTERIQRCEVDLGRLSSEVNFHSGAAERAQQATAAVEMARAVHESVDKRAQAARYLREVLLKHRDAARQRYAAPFVAALSQLARTVYGGEITFELDEDLRVTARTQGNETVSLASLSGGAREQLAILTRFAIAQLVGTESVPVIVDDALGSTDAHRLQLMATLFSHVGRDNQVLVFTCMPERYSRVPGRDERGIASLKGVI
ncbi:AAA family ATPase [Corynebacterium yonathiae]|uniref:AAA family ATPase n=1 Tax=Corynebacterium yonathiae TaxID=2913504 RepID=A0A9X3RL09_9CORY|nr:MULTISPECIES: AAA family ATPase [Corynebacterium]MCZ9295925.1 AAA family ATPase [Corynebacterium yonathiae]MDK2582790.1 AAA family ATPase [Corynebacterium sp. BWA136]